MAEPRKRCVWVTRKQTWQIHEEKKKNDKKANSVLRNIWKSLKPSGWCKEAFLIKEPST